MALTELTAIPSWLSHALNRSCPHCARGEFLSKLLRLNYKDPVLLHRLSHASGPELAATYHKVREHEAVEASL